MSSLISYVTGNTKRTPILRGKDIQLEYEYVGFGTYWTYEIRFVDRRDFRPVEILDGEGHLVTEDVGGPRGWEEPKKAYRASHPDQAQKDKMKWYETSAVRGDPKGLRNGREHVWEEKPFINIGLARMYADFAAMEKVHKQVYGTGPCLL